ncbi:long-chain-fatty-acid--CoA ligase 5 [Ixodes scapularis]
MSKLLFARRLLAVCSKWESLSSCRQWSNIGSAADRELIACQSRILPGPERIRVSAIESSKDECKSKVTTVYEAILLGRTLNDNKKAFGYWSQGLTELRWISYDELLEKCQQFGSGLLGLGQEPEKSIVTVNCRGSLEYAVSHYSLSMFSMTSCPITANADKDAIAFVLGQVESSVMVCDTIEKAEFLLSCRDKFPSLRMLILVEDPTRDIVSACRSKGLEVLSWKECLERGKKAVREPIVRFLSLLSATASTRRALRNISASRCMLTRVDSLHSYPTGPVAYDH